MPVVFFACNSENKKNAAFNVALSDTIAERSLTTDITEVSKKLPSPRFLRTGELKFKVQNVMEATAFIENKTRQMGGFVSNSSIINAVNDSTSTPVSPDSALQAIHYSVQGQLTLRVPDTQLDSLLNEVQVLSHFLIYRNITAENVSLRLLTNQWSARRADNSRQRISGDINRQKTKLSETIKAEDKFDEQATDVDNATLSNLVLEDAIRFSTVSISIYQDAGVQTSLLIRHKPVVPFELPFWDKLSTAAGEGLQIIEDLTIFIVRIWALIAVAILALLIYRKSPLYSGKIWSRRISK